MHQVVFILILLLGIATYVSAIIQMRLGQYSPSFFSRGVWLLLGVNSFAGVALSGGSASSKLLAATALIGNVAVFVVSYKKGSRDFGPTEKISLGLFLASCFIWILSNAPIINLILSLIAHFIGGIPTIRRVLERPGSEKALHWYFFFMASILTIFNSDHRTFRTILFPLYFMLFDGMVVLLANRRRLSRAG